jgi:phage major head subunit gpT-like protein
MLDLELVTNLRTTVRFTEVNEYVRIAQNLQYQKFTKVLPSTTLTQKYLQMLEGAVIRDYGQDGGSVRFEDQAFGEQSFTNHVFKSGWRESEFKFKDLDANGNVGGEGIQLLTQWTKQVTARAAYQPQHLVITALRAGTGTTMTTDNGNSFALKCFDGKALFAADHPYNFRRTSLGTYCNLFLGAPGSGAGGANNIGFKPIAGPFKKNSTTGEWEYDAGSSVSIEDGYNNLWDTIVALSAIKMADGKTPRYLKPSGIIAGPKLRKALVTILNAQFISAQSSGTGGGAQEIKGVITKLGLSEPIILDEFAGIGTNEEYDWYLVCEENLASSELGCLNIGIYEPWQTKFYAATAGEGGVNFELAISNEVAAVGQMRMFVGVSQPQFMYKQQAPRS